MNDNQIDNQTLKTKANFIRHNYIDFMDKNLLAFETLLTKKGFEVKWISDEDFLVKTIKSSLSQKSYNRVCFDISPIPNAFFETKNQIIKVSPEENEDYSDLVIKADYGIVENGSLIFLDKKSTHSFNKVSNIHVIIDINNLIEKLQDLDTILFLKYDNDFTGNSFPKDIKILKNRFTQYEQSEDNFFNNKEESKKVNVTVYFYDNGISDMMEDKKMRETLYCINCGKCKEVCPIYKIDPTYTPIEKLQLCNKAEYMEKDDIFKITTLCGNCNEVCPVQIPFTELFIYQMQIYRSHKESGNANNLQKIFLKRSKMNKLNNRFRRYFFVNRYYRKNKKLLNYFKSQKEDFYNVYLINNRED